LVCCSCIRYYHTGPTRLEMVKEMMNGACDEM
jgi:hypothetical protein